MSKFSLEFDFIGICSKLPYIHIGGTINFADNFALFAIPFYITTLKQDWTKSPSAVAARLMRIRRKLKALPPVRWPRQNIDPVRWGIFLMDVIGCKASIYMMKFGAYIPLSGRPFPHDPLTFPKMKP